MNSRQFLILRYGSLALALTGMVLWSGWSWKDQLRVHREEGLGKARLMALYMERLVQTQIILGQAAVRHGAGQGPDSPTGQRFSDFLTDVQSAQDGSRGVAIYARDGRLIAASRDFPPDLHPPVADYVQAIDGGWPLMTDRLTTAAPHRDLILIAAPVGVGDFNGLFLSALDLRVIHRFLAGIARDENEAASILRADGMLLLRRDLTGPVMLGADTRAVQEITQSDSGGFRTVAVTDNIERLYSYVRVDGLPLYVNHGIPVATIRASWLMRALPGWLFLGTLGLFSFTLAGRVQRSIRANLLAQAMREQLAATERLAEQRAQLMQELNHRVKNNLATISSLINLQLRRTGTVDAADLKARLEAIAEVHGLLLGSGDDQRVDLGQLIARLSQSPALVPPERGITVDRTLQAGIVAGSDTAVPLALILSELLTNAVKYAFPDDRAGTIRLGLVRDGDRGALLIVADDGIGTPTVTDRRSGLNIVDALARQMDARLDRRTDAGTEYRLAFPLPEPAVLTFPLREAG